MFRRSYGEPQRFLVNGLDDDALAGLERGAVDGLSVPELAVDEDEAVEGLRLRVRKGA